MNTIKQLIEKYCPDGVEYKKLGEIGTFERGKNIQKTDFLDEGFPCIHYGQIYTYYNLFTSKTIKFVDTVVASKATIAHPGDVIITTTSENMEDVGTPLGWLGNTGVAISGHSVVFHHHQNTKYITYFIASSSFSEQKKRFARGAKVIDIKATDLEKIEIPVPPLPVQREIVRILDNFTSLEAELEAELEARRKQYEYYRDQLLSFKHLTGGGKSDVEWKTLKETCDIFTGGEVPDDSIKGSCKDNEHRYPIWANGKEVYGYSSTYQIKKDATVISSIGANAGTVYFRKAFFTPIIRLKVIIPKSEKLLISKYIYFYLSTLSFVVKSSSVPNINSNEVKKIKIPIPPIERQSKIINILERFENIIENIESGLPAEIAARHQQYEYYRDQLLTFKRKA